MTVRKPATGKPNSHLDDILDNLKECKKLLDDIMAGKPEGVVAVERPEGRPDYESAHTRLLKLMWTVLHYLEVGKDAEALKAAQEAIRGDPVQKAMWDDIIGKMGLKDLNVPKTTPTGD